MRPLYWFFTAMLAVLLTLFGVPAVMGIFLALIVVGIADFVAFAMNGFE